MKYLFIAFYLLGCFANAQYYKEEYFNDKGEIAFKDDAVVTRETLFTDADSLYHFEEHYMNKKIKRTGAFKELVIKHGRFTTYYNGGLKSIEQNFKNGKLDGLSSEYYQDGTLKVEANYTNNILTKNSCYTKAGKDTVCAIKKVAELSKVLFDKDWKPTTDANAPFYRLETLDEDGQPIGTVHDYYQTGELQWEGQLYYTAIDKTADKQYGRCVWYYKNGKVKEERNYKDSSLEETQHGNCLKYYEDGVLKAKSIYKNDQLDGLLVEYFPNGKLRLEELYKDGENIKSTYYESDDKKDLLDEAARFPGGKVGLKEFLIRKLEYPKKAENKGIQGRVIVRFIINENGIISSPNIKQSVHELLDNEALRIVAMMPKWKPARKDGIPVKSYYSLPIDFSLSPEIKK